MELIVAYIRLMRLDKPIGFLLLLWPTLWAIMVAANGRPNHVILLVFTIGVVVTRSAGCIINDWWDIKYDACVARTKHRPLVENKVSKFGVLILFAILCIVALVMCVFTLKLDTIVLSIPAVLIFITYPLMKRVLAIPQAYLGIAFSFGILMAFVELQGRVTQLGWLVFFINFFWVIGYDTIYALVDLDDDKKIGIKTSAITFGKYVLFAIVLCYSIFLLGLIVLFAWLHFKLVAWFCLFGVALLLAYQCYVVYKKRKRQYFAMFLLNNQVGFLILVGVVLNYYWQSGL